MDRTGNADHEPTAPIKLEQRREAGIEWRRRMTLEAQAHWQPSHDRRDPVDILIEQGTTRIPELLPRTLCTDEDRPFCIFARVSSGNGRRSWSNAGDRLARAIIG